MHFIKNKLKNVIHKFKTAEENSKHSLNNKTDKLHFE